MFLRTVAAETGVFYAKAYDFKRKVWGYIITSRKWPDHWLINLKEVDSVLLVNPGINWGMVLDTSN